MEYDICNRGKRSTLKSFLYSKIDFSKFKTRFIVEFDQRPVRAISMTLYRTGNLQNRDRAGIVGKRNDRRLFIMIVLNLHVIKISNRR